MRRLIFALLLTSLQGFAVELPYLDGAPQCPAHGSILPVNNDQVLNWKQSTPNQFHDRAHVSGPVIQTFPDMNGHVHFVIQIGKSANDNLEVIYNQDFGTLKDPAIGMQVEACGDYITSTAQSGQYPPSPVGAIVHWVHKNPNGKHDSGFLMVDGVLYGQDAEHAGPKH